MKNHSFKTVRVVFILFLLIFAIGERLYFDLGPNVELISTLSILVSLYFGWRWGSVLSLFVLWATDSYLGNNSIFLFTWSAYFTISFVSPFLAKKISFFKEKLGKKAFFSAGMGIAASLFFYTWTNFGVWVLDSWGMYPKTMLGLITCLIAGLPFLRLNLLGNLVFLPSFTLAIEVLPQVVVLVKKHLAASWSFNAKK